MIAARTLLLLTLAAGLQGSDVELVLVAPHSGADASVRGVLQGLDEARRQASFLGISYVLTRAEAVDPSVHSGADALFIVGSPDEIIAAAEAAPGVPVFNIVSTDDALRTACRPNLFHTAPTKAMLAAAEAQWGQAHPEDQDVEAHGWRAGFFKFSARELNRRFKQAQGAPMDSDAWAAWAAVKLYSDAVANNPDADGEALIRYLRQDMEFDGAKGAFLTFRETGQLRQPLLLTVGGKLRGEAPVRGVAAYDELDSLGLLKCQ